MATKTYSFLRTTYSVAALLTFATPLPAKADFFDDLRQTFQSDIPHFFQDDIPCTFGGQPTSHTKTSCKSGHEPKRTHEKDRDGTDGRPEEPPETEQPPPNSGR